MHPLVSLTLFLQNPILSIATKSKWRIERHGSKYIGAKEAVVHIVDTENVENTNETAALLNRNESELTRTTFDTVESLSVSVPGLKQSKVRFKLYYTIQWLLKR